MVKIVFYIWNARHNFLHCYNCYTSGGNKKNQVITRILNIKTIMGIIKEK